MRSDICQTMDGKVFDMKDYQPGTTCPPFHVFCRSTTVPYFDKEYDITGSRAARDGDGKTYYVSGDMRYSEWEKAFVKGDKSGFDLTEVDGTKYYAHKNNGEKLGALPLDKNGADDIIKSEQVNINLSSFPDEFNRKNTKNQTQTFIDYVNNVDRADADMKKIYNSIGKMTTWEGNNVGTKITYTHIGNSAGSGADCFELRIPPLDAENPKGSIHTTVHEFGHYIDDLMRPDPTGNFSNKGWMSSQNDKLVKAIENSRGNLSDEIENVFADYTKKRNAIIENLNDEWKDKQKDYKTYRQYCNAYKAEYEYRLRNEFDGMNSLQDIYDALSNGKLLDS